MDPDTCFAVGREHVPKLRSVRTASVFVIDALLRHAVNCMSPRRRGAHGERYDIEATKRRRSVGVRLVRKAKIFSGAGGRARGLCCGGGRVGARAIVFDKRFFVKRSFERAWVSALAALARGRRTFARALSARVWAWARAASKHGAANTAAHIDEVQH